MKTCWVPIAKFRIESTGDTIGREAERRILSEIDRLTGLLSSYDWESELSRWQRSPGVAMRLSEDLLNVLEQCDVWYRASGGAFDARTAALQRLWSAALSGGHLPDSREITNAVAAFDTAPWTLDRNAQTALLAPGVQLSLDGLAKGYIIDRACESAMNTVGVTGALINIGGDMRVVGAMALAAGVANPFGDGEGTITMARVPVLDGAVATSGNYHRYTELDGERYSHILDPKTGQPVETIVSATVTAGQAVDADALATTLNVLTPDAGIALVERVAGAECLLVTRKGDVIPSSGWSGPHPLHIEPDGRAAEAVRYGANDSWGDRYSLTVNFEVANPEIDGRYRRPYVGIWICDAEGFPIRTLLLWQQKDGLRWLPSLREWYRDDQIRSFVDATDLIGSVSRSTRPPGNYDVVWDGKDDLGNTLPPGNYGLRIEAAREHGTHQVMKQDLVLGDAPFEIELEGNVEISHARINYRRLEIRE